MNDIDMQHMTSYGFSLFLLDLVIFSPSPFLSCYHAKGELEEEWELCKTIFVDIYIMMQCLWVCNEK